MYLSIESYINYFSLAEKIRFSFKHRIFLFIIPTIFYFLYLLVSVAIKNRPMEGSQNLMVFFSLFLFWVHFLAFSFLTMLKEIYFLKVILSIKKQFYRI
ncbi:MAG TPA: hypothetical protein DIS95_16975 [Proteus vulgaris]|nr:hypothetical protein [Proteus vulgaris]